MKKEELKKINFSEITWKELIDTIPEFTELPYNNIEELIYNNNNIIMSFITLSYSGLEVWQAVPSEHKDWLKYGSVGKGFIFIEEKN